MTHTETFIGKYCCPINIIDYEKKTDTDESERLW